MTKRSILLGVVGLCAAATVFAVGRQGGGHPKTAGLSVGDSVSPFHPNHVSGPDKNTDTCPVCKYGALPAVQVWVNGSDPAPVVPIARVLNEKVGAGPGFKAFVVFVSDPAQSSETAERLGSVAQENNWNNVALTWIGKDQKALQDYKFDASSNVKNVVLVYKDRKVTRKFVNLKTDAQSLKHLQDAIDKVAPAKSASSPQY